jgi:c-di-AMP phosphodiesterase-like protein
MEAKYKAWHRIQIISCISYVVLLICLYFMMKADLPDIPLIIIAVLAAGSLVATTASGLIRAYIGHKMGMRSTKKDYIIAGIAIILAVIYLILKNFY